MSIGPTVGVFRGQQGFILLEIMLSLVILTIMATVLAGSLWDIVRWQADTAKKLQAVTVASQQLDTLIYGLYGHNMPKIPLPEGVTVSHQVQGYPVTILSGLQIGKKQVAYERVSVQVQWHDTVGQKHDVLLCSGRMRGLCAKKRCWFFSYRMHDLLCRTDGADTLLF